MKPFQIIAWGVAIMLVCLGMGGCEYLRNLGSAAIKHGDKARDVNINLMLKKATP